MSQELHFTSAPRGLKPGSSDYCTVAATSGLSGPMTQLLEALSGYRWVFPPSGPQAALNPVAYAHYRIAQAGRYVDVLSRVCSSGLDYTNRSNKYGHHLVLDAAELPQAGPAWLALRDGFFDEVWTGAPRLLPTGRAVPQGEEMPAICERWGDLTGDPGWAGIVARALASPERGRRTVFLVYEPGRELLPLVAEALALLEPAQRWEVNFNTYFTGLTLDVACHLRGVLAGSEEARQATRLPGSEIIDLTRGDLGRAEDDPWVVAARTGVVAEVWKAPEGPVARPAPTRVARPVRRSGPAAKDDQTDLSDSSLGDPNAPPPLRPGQARPTLPPAVTKAPRTTATKKWLPIAVAAGAVVFLGLGFLLAQALAPKPVEVVVKKVEKRPSAIVPPEGLGKGTSDPGTTTKKAAAPPATEVAVTPPVEPTPPEAAPPPVVVKRAAPTRVDTLSQAIVERDDIEHRAPQLIIVLDKSIAGKVATLDLIATAHDQEGAPRFPARFVESALQIHDRDLNTSPIAKVEAKGDTILFSWLVPRSPEMAAQLRDQVLAVVPEDPAAPPRLYYLRSRLKKPAVELGKRVDEALTRSKAKLSNRELTGADIDWGPEGRPTVDLFWGAYRVEEPNVTTAAPHRETASVEELLPVIDLPPTYSDWDLNAMDKGLRAFFDPAGRRIQLDNDPITRNVKFQKVHIDLFEKGKVLPDIAPELVGLAKRVGDISELDKSRKALLIQIKQATEEQKSVSQQNPQLAQQYQPRIDAMTNQLGPVDARFQCLNFIRNLYRVKVHGALCAKVGPVADGPPLFVELARLGEPN